MYSIVIQLYMYMYPFFIGVLLIYNVMRVLSVHQSDPPIHIRVSIYFIGILLIYSVALASAVHIRVSIYFTGIWLIYNVAFLSSVQHSGPFMHSQIQFHVLCC